MRLEQRASAYSLSLCSSIRQKIMKKLTKEEMLQIPTMVADLNYAQIAQELGVQRSTIDKAVQRLRKAGIEVPTRKGPKPIKL